jgi:hypothetical protein
MFAIPENITKSHGFKAYKDDKYLNCSDIAVINLVENGK